MPVWIIVPKIAGGGYIYFVDPDDIVRPNILEECVAELQATDSDAVVFGVQIKSISKDDNVMDVSAMVPSEQRYCCHNLTQIIQGPFRYMFGTPGEEMAQTMFHERYRYTQFPWNWCWVYRADIILNNRIRFKEDLTLREDGIFTCEFLMHANRTACLQAIGYEYHHRADGTAGTLHRNVKTENKLLLVKYRSLISQYILQETGIDTRTWADGSYVLSVLQLCVSLAGKPHGYASYKKYIALQEVKEAVRRVPLKGKPVLICPLILCKMRCYWLLYGLVALLKKIGFPMNW